MQDLLELRDAAAVQRWHTMRTLRTQSVGEHSFGVAQLVLWVCPNHSRRLLEAALAHDLPELHTGDIPAYVKWRAPQIKSILEKLENDFMWKHDIYHNLDEEERRTLKWCDMMELVLWCHEEIELGNTHHHVRIAIYNVMKLLEELGHPTEKARILYSDVKSKRNANRRLPLPSDNPALGFRIRK